MSTVNLTNRFAKAWANPASLYAIKPDPRDGFKVILKRTGKVYFYGSRSECREWIERNDGDENN